MADGQTPLPVLSPPQALHTAPRRKRFLIHLEVANQHRLPRAVALARTLARGGHEAAISCEEQIAVRFDPADTVAAYLDARGLIDAWRGRAPDVGILPVDTYDGPGVAGLSGAQDKRREALGSLIAAQAPDHVMIWGGNFEYQAGTRDAIAGAGLADRTLFFEVGWLPQQPYLYFDTMGTNSGSSLVGYTAPPLSRHQSWLLRDTLDRMLAERGGANGPRPGDKTVLVPLQIETDTSFRLGSPFASNAEFLGFLETWLPPDWSAVLKLHPKERLRGWPPTPRRRNFRVVESGSLDRMMLSASHVIGINSTVLIEAAALGRPAVAFGRGLFSGSGLLTEATPGEPAQEVLDRPVDQDARDRFLYELLFRRQVSVEALERADYGHLISREPFESLLGELEPPGRTGRMARGEAMIQVGRSRVARTAVLDVEHGGEITVGDDSDIRHNAVLEVSGRYGGSIRIGDHSVIGVGSWLQGSGQIEIGDDVIIGPYAAIVSSSHQHADSTRPVARQPLDTGTVTIENDVWMGAHVTVAMNVRIGAHSIIGANAFVNSDIPPYSVAVGSPARVVRTRER